MNFPFVIKDRRLGFQVLLALSCFIRGCVLEFVKEKIRQEVSSRIDIFDSPRLECLDSQLTLVLCNKNNRV
jgi:hypothetical protein